MEGDAVEPGHAGELDPLAEPAALAEDRLEFPGRRRQRLVVETVVGGDELAVLEELDREAAVIVPGEVEIPFHQGILVAAVLEDLGVHHLVAAVVGLDDELVVVVAVLLVAPVHRGVLHHEGVGPVAEGELQVEIARLDPVVAGAGGEGPVGVEPLDLGIGHHDDVVAGARLVARAMNVRQGIAVPEAEVVAAVGEHLELHLDAIVVVRIAVVAQRVVMVDGDERRVAHLEHGGGIRVEVPRADLERGVAEGVRGARPLGSRLEISFQMHPDPVAQQKIVGGEVETDLRLFRIDLVEHAHPLARSNCRAPYPADARRPRAMVNPW